MSSPEVKKVQGRHGFQNRKLVDQQSEDHHDPVDTSVDFEHVAFIANLKENTKQNFKWTEKNQSLNDTSLLSDGFVVFTLGLPRLVN